MKSEIELNNLALNLRIKFKLDLVSPIDIFSIVKTIPKLTLVFFSMGENISGLCFKDLNLIAINLNHSYGRCRFTLAHELYHFYYDQEVTKTICTQTINDSSPTNEREADLFATYFLAPYYSFKQSIEGFTKDNVTEQKIIELEQYYGLSRLAMLYRLKKENIIDSNQWDNFKKNVITSAKALGYDDKLYKKNYEESKTYGYYITLVNKLAKQNIISKGKENELLLDAFRSDLVNEEINEAKDFID